MRLLLSDSVVGQIASTCSFTGDLALDSEKVLQEIIAFGHSPLTRKDVTAVLMKLGHENPSTEQCFVIGDSIRRWCKSSPCGKKGMWVFKGEAPVPLPTLMTETGTQVAAPRLKKNQQKSPRETTGATALWFQDQIKAGLDRKVANQLRHKFPQEPFEELLAETRLWFMTWSKNGTCDSYLEKGKPPTIPILTIWVKGKIVHRLYKEGQDALSRHLKGVRTQGEITQRSVTGKDFIVEDALRSDPSAPKAIWVGGKEEGDLHREFVSHEEPLFQELDKEEIDLIRDVIKIRRQDAGEKLTRVLDHMIEGRSREETALLEGESELRISNLCQKVRDDLRQAPVILEVALRVLQAISQEPFSSKEDIEEEVHKAPEEIKVALDLLRLRGLVKEKGSNSFLVTREGRTCVQSESLL